jgi:hypothetical protein
MLYVYGYMRAGDIPDALGVGIESGGVSPLVEGDLAALVTEVEDVAPRRANLLAHADVLARALEHGPVLPLKFGMLAEEESVRAALATQAGDLALQLDAFDGRIEMSVSALYREDVVLGEVIAENPAVGEVQRRIAGQPEAATHFERIRLGELVAHAVEAKREADSGAILSELEPHAVAITPDALLHERMVVNAAFLVERSRLEEFDAAVEAISRARAERMQFKLLGPRAPHSFVGAG